MLFRLIIFLSCLISLTAEPFVLKTDYPGKLNVNYSFNDEYFVYAPRFGVESGVFVFCDGNNEWEICANNNSIDRLIDVETIGDWVFTLTTTECNAVNLKTEQSQVLDFDPSSSSSMIIASENVLAVSSEHIIMTYEYLAGYWLRTYGGPPQGSDDEFAEYRYMETMAVDDDMLLVALHGDDDSRSIVMSYLKKNNRWVFGGRIFFMTDEDYFGYRLAVDGRRCAVYSSVPGKPEMGGITTFIYNDFEWNLEEFITPPDNWFFDQGRYGELNVSVDLHDNYMAIGVYDDDGTNAKVYIYKYNESSGWSVINTLYPNNRNAESYFGKTLRFSPSGRLVVESPGTDEMYFYDDYYTAPNVSVVQSEKESSLQCYPNPVNTGTTIHFESENTFPIEILDINGRLVKTCEANSSILLNLSVGTYFYRKSGEVIAKKLIVK